MKTLSKILKFLLILGFVLGLVGCPWPKNDDDKPNPTPTLPSTPYDGFYNYPTGRVDPNNGRLTINNTIASEVLLFDGKVDKDAYLGTISSLGSVRVKLPEQKFYTIVAVQKAKYEERGAQAIQFSEMAYYSDTQTFTISVSPSAMWGGGNWVFDNFTKYWIEVRKADLSQNYAVIQPNAKRVTIPIEIDAIYDYSLYYSRALKYNSVIIAKAETSNPKKDNTAQVTTGALTFTTTIEDVDVSPTVKPFVLVKNESDKTVRVYYSQTQKANGAPGGDFVVTSGRQLIFTDFEAGNNTSNINFRALAWTPDNGGNRQVPAAQGMNMQINKTYIITIPRNENAADITVEEVDSSNYYD